MPITITPELIAERKYPGMLPLEAGIMSTWLGRHAVEYDSVEFNVRLGPGVDFSGLLDPVFARRAAELSQLRADAILHRQGGATIVEVKVNISPAAMGQVLAYGYHYAVEHPHEVPPHLVIIGRRMVANLEEVFKRSKVAWELFP